MKFITFLFPILFLALLEVPAQTPSEPTQEESTSEEKKLTRIVGQPRTKSENDAWIAITKMENHNFSRKSINFGTFKRSQRVTWTFLGGVEWVY